MTTIHGMLKMTGRFSIPLFLVQIWRISTPWIQAHDAAVSKIAWSHPEFGTIIVSSSFDRTVRIWEQTSSGQSEASQQTSSSSTTTLPNGSTSQTQLLLLLPPPPPPPPCGPVNPCWVERAVLSDAKGTVRAVKFAPHHFGLKLVRWVLVHPPCHWFFLVFLGKDIDRQYMNAWSNPP